MRKNYLDLLDECCESATKKLRREYMIRHLSEDEGTFIGTIVPVAKQTSRGHKRLFYVDERGNLIPPCPCAEPAQ